MEGRFGGQDWGRKSWKLEFVCEGGFGRSRFFVCRRHNEYR